MNLSIAFGRPLSVGRFAASFLLGLLVLAVGGSMAARAQTGQITGRIVDPTGAVLPGATVTIKKVETGEKRILQTNSDGYYTAPALLPGNYSIVATHEGFASVSKTGLELQVDQVLRSDIQLPVGSSNQEVTVSSGPPQLDTETSTVGAVVDAESIVQLPLLGRDAYALAELVPGVRPNANMNSLPVDISQTSAISVNGVPQYLNDFLLDGSPNSAPFINQPLLYPIADSVQEFKVQTNNYSAEYGRAMGGIFDVDTKAGSNKYHFSVYEFYRNDKMSAHDYFDQPGQAVPPLTFNQFGGVLGGPLTIPGLHRDRNKTFFFVGTELARFDQGNTYTARVPDPAQLAGDFSNDYNSAGSLIKIYNPFSTHLVGTVYTRDQFSGNNIAAYINPVAKAMASYFPKPNVTPTTVGGSNYVLVTSGKIVINQYTVRLDHNFTDRTRMFGRYSYSDTKNNRPSPYPTAGAAGYGPQDFDRKNAVVEADHVFTPSLFGYLRASFSRLGNLRGPISQGFDISTLGLPPGLAQQIGAPAAFPAVTITGYSVASSQSGSSAAYALGDTGLLSIFSNYYTFQGGVTKTIKSHELVVGGESRIIQANLLQTADNSTVFNFTPAFTQGPNAKQASTTGGDALASFLLGTPNGGSVSPSPAMEVETKYFAGFIQDNWKATSRLTLNLGIRYDFETPKTDRHNQFTNFDPNALVPLATPVPVLHGALSFPGASGNSRYQADPEFTHVQPRVGFAWQAAQNTVVRGGIGQFFGNTWGTVSAPSNFGISGWTTATSMVTSLDTVTPYTTLSNPYPTGLNAATGNSLGSATLLGQDIAFYDRNNKTPSAVQWNFGIEQNLPSAVMLSVAYVGMHAIHIPLTIPLNQLPDSALALGNSLNDQVTNPFYGQIATGTLAQPKVARSQLLRPYPQFTAVSSQFANIAASRYDSLQTRLEKRMKSGFSLMVNYTWSKMIDQAPGNFPGETVAGATVQDYNNLKGERSISNLDQTNRFIFATVYQLPFQRQQTHLLGHIAGGWEISLLGTFFSGDPLGIASATNTTNSLGGGQRPNWNGINPSLSNRSVNKWFDTSVFSAPAAYTFGNSPRTFSFLRSDWTRNLDLSIHKNTVIHDNLHVQFRADAFNVDNTPVFSPPNTSFGSAQFGIVNSTANIPRTIQLGVKLLY